uniref:LIM zinc-binding domain-containing protein n=1 Tax=Globodera pallida TaxID=36090 RepID=A0A183BXM1_GLOPA
MSFCLSSRDFKNPLCQICEKDVPPTDKIVVDRLTIHKSCFTCAICDKPLQQGSCNLERGLARYGTFWLCREHSLIPPGEKEELIVKKGYKERSRKK